VAGLELDGEIEIDGSEDPETPDEPCMEDSSKQL